MFRLLEKQRSSLTGSGAAFTLNLFSLCTKRAACEDVDKWSFICQREVTLELVLVPYLNGIIT